MEAQGNGQFKDWKQQDLSPLPVAADVGIFSHDVYQQQ